MEDRGGRGEWLIDWRIYKLGTRVSCSHWDWHLLAFSYSSMCFVSLRFPSLTGSLWCCRHLLLVGMGMAVAPVLWDGDGCSACCCGATMFKSSTLFLIEPFQQKILWSFIGSGGVTWPFFNQQSLDTDTLIGLGSGVYLIDPGGLIGHIDELSRCDCPTEQNKDASRS